MNGINILIVASSRQRRTYILRWQLHLNAVALKEAEQREALQRGLHRLRRSAELCRERLATGELRPLDALRPLEPFGWSFEFKRKGLRQLRAVKVQIWGGLWLGQSQIEVAKRAKVEIPRRSHPQPLSSGEISALALAASGCVWLRVVYKRSSLHNTTCSGVLLVSGVTDANDAAHGSRVQAPPSERYVEAALYTQTWRRQAVTGSIVGIMGSTHVTERLSSAQPPALVGEMAALGCS